jgi:hypothetical protein
MAETKMSRGSDEVEISGQVDAQAKTLHADSLTFLEKGSAMCAAPAKKTNK